MSSEISIEDRMKILDLCARYQQLFDDGLAEAWADTFLADGRFEGPAGVASGRAELISFCQRVSAQYPDALHFTDQHVLDSRPGGIVQHRCILSVQYPVERSVRIALYRYSDELLKSEDGWKFKSRHVLPA